MLPTDIRVKLSKDPVIERIKEKEMEFCERCGQSEEVCRCPDFDNSTRRDLEDYQDAHGLSNDEMTEFIRENDIVY